MITELSTSNAGPKVEKSGGVVGEGEWADTVAEKAARER